MKQHILRLLIVLILVVGIGLIVFYFVKDNSTFNVLDYANENFEKNSQTYSLIEELNDNVNSDFSENKVIYDSLKESFGYFANFLTNTITKSERDIIKNDFSKFNESFNNLNISLNSLKNYLNESNLNETELTGRENKASGDFKELNFKFLELNLKLENMVKDKVFEGKYLDASFALTSCKNLLCKIYLTVEENSNQHFVNDVINKVSKLKENYYQVSDDSIVFAIKYNENISEVENSFTYFFEHNEVPSNLSELVELLNKGEYYEET